MAGILFMVIARFIIMSFVF
jgi:hypothetical protein